MTGMLYMVVALFAGLHSRDLSVLQPLPAAAAVVAVGLWAEEIGGWLSGRASRPHSTDA